MLHEDFFFIEDTTMEARDEWFQATTELVERSVYTP